MTRINYKEYISSTRWLLKKHELIEVYLKQGWDISCNICQSEQNLNVHHKNYSQIGEENLKDDGSGDIHNLEFLCRECHKKWHFNSIFRKKVEQERDKKFWEVINKITTNG
jgi:hypothetical protein